MELSHKAAVEVAASLKKLLSPLTIAADVVICPSFIELPALAELFGRSSKITLGAQNVHWLEKGPWTGEVSVNQLTPFVKWCIVGHSERRALTGEGDEHVFAKANLLLASGITPIICIGETAAERAGDQTMTKITTQVKGLLAAMDRTSFGQVVIAYEPIWAVGTGEMPEPNNVAGTMLLIRKLAAEYFDQEVAEKVRIVYGGSVKPETVKPFVTEPGVDGVLVGGASVHPLDFISIINHVQTI